MWSMLCSKCYSQLIKCEPKSMTEPCPVNLTYLECSQYSPVVLPAGPRRKLLEFHSYLSLEDFILTFPCTNVCCCWICLLCLFESRILLEVTSLWLFDSFAIMWMTVFTAIQYIIEPFFFLNLSCQMYFGTFCPHVCFVLWTKPPEQSCTLVWMLEKFLYFGADVPYQDRLPKWSEQLLLTPEFAGAPWCSPSNRR